MSTLPDLAAVTLDVDWAPDFVVDEIAGLLAKRGVRATWFVTHASAAIDRLRRRPDLFELGIHPNFAQGSTHGGDPDSVLAHCMELAPEAKAMRTHSLIQSSSLLTRALELTPIEADVSLFLPSAPHVSAIQYQLAAGVMTRLPYIWEDDTEMLRDRPDWDLDPLLDGPPGLKIFDFHPVHLALNSATTAGYDALKQEVPSLMEAGTDAIDRFRNEGLGARTAFEALLDRLGGDGSHRVLDIVARVRPAVPR